MSSGHKLQTVFKKSDVTVWWTLILIITFNFFSWWCYPGQIHYDHQALSYFNYAYTLLTFSPLVVLFTDGCLWSEPVDSKGIAGNDIAQFDDKSVAKCKAECQAQGTRCRSMDYNYSGSVCKTQDVTPQQAGEAFGYNPSEENYEKLCDQS